MLTPKHLMPWAACCTCIIQLAADKCIARLTCPALAPKRSEVCQSPQAPLIFRALLLQSARGQRAAQGDPCQAFPPGQSARQNHAGPDSLRCVCTPAGTVYIGTLPPPKAGAFGQQAMGVPLVSVDAVQVTAQRGKKWAASIAGTKLESCYLVGPATCLGLADACLIVQPCCGSCSSDCFARIPAHGCEYRSVIGCSWSGIGTP